MGHWGAATRGHKQQSCMCKQNNKVLRVVIGTVQRELI